MGNNYAKRMYPLWALIPGVVIYFIFFVFPFIIAIRYSFTNWDFYTSRYIGLRNYIAIFSENDMLVALKNTFLFTVITTIFKVGLGMVIAVFVNQQLRTTKYFRSVVFVPVLLSTIAAGIIFNAILHPTNGLLNQFFGMLHLNFLQQEWLTNVNLAIYSIMGIEIWKYAGFCMVLILAGLQSISKDYYESADIDGASSWSKFWHITFPLVIPAFNVCVVTSLIGGLKVFDIVQVTTQGGPGFATDVLNTVIFRSFGSLAQGMASAQNVVLCLIVMVVATFAYTLIRRKEVEQ